MAPAGLGADVPTDAGEIADVDAGVTLVPEHATAPKMRAATTTVTRLRR
jgi:hypothetical protein